MSRPSKIAGSQDAFRRGDGCGKLPISVSEVALAAAMAETKILELHPEIEKGAA
jgi:hypothetical protein